MFKSRRHRSHSLPQGKLALIVAGLLFVIASIAVIVFMFSHGLSTIAQDQLTAIRENDLQKAYAMTTAGFRNQTTFQTFKEYIDSYPVLRQNKAVDFNEVKIEDDFGYLHGSIEAKDGSVMEIEYQFVKEDGKWKIQAIRLSPVEE